MTNSYEKTKPSLPSIGLDRDGFFPYSFLCFLFLPQKCNTDFELIGSFITSAQRSENTENSVHDSAEGIVLPVVRLDLLAFFLCGEKIFLHSRNNTGAIKQRIIFKMEEKTAATLSFCYHQRLGSDTLLSSVGGAGIMDAYRTLRRNF